MKKYNVAVIGATGNVGSETLNTLAERQFPVDNIYALASSNSLGKEISFGDDILKIKNIDDFDFTKIDIVFFSAGSEVSKKYIPKAVKAGCIVIDKSSTFRLDPDVPLVVPEANAIAIGDYKKTNIIANPNCCTIILSVVLKPLDNAAKIKRLVISTYQSTSGAGKAGMDELYNQTKAKYVFEDQQPVIFSKQIAFNLFPLIGDIIEDSSTSEETKINLELAKIIGNHIKSSITCVRVPVFVGHSMSVNIEFENVVDVEELSEILGEADGITVISHDNDQQFISPVEIVGEEHVFVSRIRQDSSCPNSINLWITGDNLRKGAALNAVQIAEELIKNYL